jgi:hypothetical protein
MTNPEMNENEIEPIIPIKMCSTNDDKIFQIYDEDTGEPIGGPYSLNDFRDLMLSISGVSEDLLGPPA